MEKNIFLVAKNHSKDRFLGVPYPEGEGSAPPALLYKTNASRYLNFISIHKDRGDEKTNKLGAVLRCKVGFKENCVGVRCWRSHEV